MVSMAQNKDSAFLCKEVDAMDGTTFVYSNRNFVCANEEKTKGFKVDIAVNSKDEPILFYYITVNMVGLGSCNEKDEIIILFENGEKIIKKSWKEFNCDGRACFFVDNKELQLLRTLQLSKIRMTNGRSYENYTGDVKDKDKRYFIQLIYSIDNNLTTVKK